jgi:hypothetical protein
MQRVAQVVIATPKSRHPFLMQNIIKAKNRLTILDSDYSLLNYLILRGEILIGLFSFAPWSRVYLEKLIVAQLIIFPAFYGTQCFKKPC